MWLAPESWLRRRASQPVSLPDATGAFSLGGPHTTASDKPAQPHRCRKPPFIASLHGRGTSAHCNGIATHASDTNESTHELDKEKFSEEYLLHFKIWRAACVLSDSRALRCAT